MLRLLECVVGQSWRPRTTSGEALTACVTEAQPDHQHQHAFGSGKAELLRQPSRKLAQDFSSVSMFLYSAARKKTVCD